MSGTHNVFISHRHEDDGLVGELTKMLEARGLNIRNSSITSENPNDAKNVEYIKTLLRPLIDWAGKMIVIITPDTKNHWWVDWEIEYANNGDKQIIGVWAPGTTLADMPEGLQDYAHDRVNWDADAIIAALNGTSTWTDPDGVNDPAPRIRSINC